jgi:predicted negative regulator of RcsB-dependent stress response
LGDTYVQLKQNDKAKESYKKAAEMPVTLDSEKVYQEEAKKKLAKL